MTNPKATTISQNLYGVRNGIITTDKCISTISTTISTAISFNKDRVLLLIVGHIIVKVKYSSSPSLHKSNFITFAQNLEMAQIGTNIEVAKSILDQSGIVAIPTETVYGLAGNALDMDAVTAIFKTKERPSFDPLIVHTYSLNQVKQFVEYIPEKAIQLAERYWPGPLTLLLPKKASVPDLVTSGLNTVAVRVPNHPLTLELLQQIDYPLAAPSANPFGYISPTSAFHVDQQLGDKIEYILDGGHSSIGVESTIIGFENDILVVHRLGGMSVERIESIVGKVQIKEHSTSNPTAPGMLKSHYAPKKKIILGDIDQLLQDHKGENPGILSFSASFDLIDSEKQIQLSDNGNLDEAAQNLFRALRQLDAMNVSVILAEQVPNHGLGRAINDRLKRAAAK